MFQFPSLASATYVFSDGSRGFAAGGCPIRKSPGQSLLGGSPELIAACPVLHRPLTPPPRAALAAPPPPPGAPWLPKPKHEENHFVGPPSRSALRRGTLRPSGEGWWGPGEFDYRPHPHH